jgi:ATP-dependent DNA helicase DinG
MSKVEGSLQGRYIINDEMIDNLVKIHDIVKNSMIGEEARHIHRVSFMNKATYGSELEDLFEKLKKVLDNKYIKWINYDEKKFSMISETFPTDFRKFLDFLKQNNKIIIMSGTLTTNGDFSSLLAVK